MSDRDTDSGGQPADGRFEVAQFPAPPEVVQRYYQGNNTHPPVVPPPPPPPPYVKTKKDLLDQAHGDDTWAKEMNRTGDALERGSDSLYDLGSEPIKVVGSEEC